MVVLFHSVIMVRLFFGVVCPYLSMVHSSVRLITAGCVHDIGIQNIFQNGVLFGGGGIWWCSFRF